MSSNPALTGKFSCPSTSSHASPPAHVDYLLVVSPGKLTHSQAKVNKSRRNSHMIERKDISGLSEATGIYQKCLSNIHTVPG